jgi:hypothetical protein
MHAATAGRFGEETIMAFRLCGPWQRPLAVQVVDQVFDLAQVGLDVAAQAAQVVGRRAHVAGDALGFL